MNRIVGSKFVSTLSLAVATLTSACLWQESALAQEVTQLPPVDVASTPSGATLSTAPLTTAILPQDRLRASRSRSSDTARLLTGLPGMSANTGGGFSSMPAIRGLNEQRLNILVDGHPIESACPNDMNPPLSYTNPQTVGAVRVVTGVSPVSMGGDSIGGVIAVDSAAPQFATGSDLLLKGEASAFYRSNDDGFGGSMSVTVASRNLSATYTGSYTQADSYEGGGHRGTVHSSAYAKTDHALALAYQNTLGLFELKGGYHFSPYEGFVNQYMDMTSNKSWFLNGHYAGVFDWGTLDLKADYRDTDHAMNFLADKGGSADGGMPMNTEVHSVGYTIKADIPVSARDTIRVGNEYRHQWLNDYWPPVDMMMMGPDTYININGATRNRIGAFAEWEARWTPQLSTLVGARYDHVRMNTGAVQHYNDYTDMMNMADTMAAMAFNMASHRKRDNNWSGSALLSYAPAETVSLELGYAHKVRSPNIYERYSWGKGSMSSRMIGWFGDGNGYVGNLALQPERADTVSAALEVRGGGKQGWSVKVAPYYTHVNDYIDAIWLKNLSGGFVQLQFANQKAEFYGADVSGSVPLWQAGEGNSTRLDGTLSYVHGQNLSDHGALYHQMPLNVKLALEHRQNGIEVGAELEYVAEKNRVDATRYEPQTNDYALVNLRAAYNWRAFRLSLEVENLFDKGYDLPLGGLSLGDFLTDGTIRPVPGRGRSVNVGLSVRI